MEWYTGKRIVKRVGRFSKGEKLALAKKLGLSTSTLRECGAKLRHPGKRGDYVCHSPFVSRNGRCRMHGGNARGGAASGVFKHGLYSRYVPEGLREDYERVRTDHDLTHLNEELALLTLRISTLLGRLEDSAPPWELVLRKWGEAAQRAGGSLGPEFDELRAVICDGVASAVAERQVWDELRSLVQEKTRTAAAEWSRLRDLQGLVKLDQVMALVRGVLEAVRSNVTDPILLKAVTADVLRFIPAPSGAVIDAEG